jgi:hypothetical protein
MSEGSMPVATDPLGAIRVELVNAARRRAIARRRRQRLATVGATTVATLAMATGAGALIAGSTGVSAIDDWLGLLESSTQGPSGQVEHAAPRVTAMPGTATVPLLAANGMVAVAYVNKDGDVCYAIAKPHGEGAGEAREGWGCMAPDALSRSLAGDAAFVANVRAPDGVVVIGFARPEVERLGVKGPGGPFNVKLGGQWTPEAAGAVATRLFVAVGKSGGADAVGDLRGYSIEARMEGGQTVTVGP